MVVIPKAARPRGAGFAIFFNLAIEKTLCRVFLCKKNTHFLKYLNACLICFMGRQQPKFFVYLLECRDKSLYCGYTNDLEARIKLHNEGRASKYTKPRRPVRLAYSEELESKGQAMKREAKIKKMPRKQKQNLVLRFTAFS